MEQEYYIFVRQGKVQHRLGKDKEGHTVAFLMMAESQEDAMKACRHFKWNDLGVRPALVGSVDGETLEGHIQLALEAGCVGAVCIHGWNPDGSPVPKFIMFDQKPPHAQ